MFCKFHFELLHSIFWIFLKQIALKSDSFYYEKGGIHPPYENVWTTIKLQK
jgi:hypothetical protein